MSIRELLERRYTPSEGGMTPCAVDDATELGTVWVRGEAWCGARCPLSLVCEASEYVSAL